MVCFFCEQMFVRASARATHEAMRHAGEAVPTDVSKARLSEAIEARRARERGYYRFDPEPRRIRMRLYRQTEPGRRADAAATRRKVARGAYAALRAVKRAVRTGVLTRQPCEVCRAPRAQAHHWLGYAREHWLDVRWLCGWHHAEVHRLAPSRGVDQQSLWGSA